MATPLNKLYLLGEFVLEPDARRLTRAGAEVRLARRPFEVLLYLIENSGRLVSTEELLEQFWEGHDVYENTARKAVGAVRKALDDHSGHPRFIETRWAGGYRYVGPLAEQTTPGVIEIERARGVKITVTGETFAPVAVAALPQPRRFPRPVLAVLALLILSALAWTAFRPTNNNAATPPAPARSLAVLPLQNLTGDPANEYLSDGLTDSVINELARINELKVISRASSFAFKNKNTDAREVGQKLGVAYILEGSLSKNGERIRVNLRLVSTVDGRVLWAGDSYERALADIFAVQDEISCSVAEHLRGVLCGAQPHKRYTANADAYQAYLKGRFYWNKRTGDGIKKSLEHYREAIKLDADYALAYAGLADSYVQGVWHVPFAPEEVLPKAKAAALRAVALDDSLAEAHTALAGVYSMEWNWAATGRELQRAIELNPNYARACHAQAFHLMVTGHYDEAVAAIKRAAALDPLNLVISTDVANIFFGVRRVDEAFRQWKKTLELDPNFSLVYRQRAEASVFQGDEAAAAADYLKEMELNGEAPEKIAAYRQAYAAHGLKGFWQTQLDEVLTQQSRGGYASPIGLAYLYMRLGKKDEALAHLEQVYRARSVTILLAVSPMYDSLRSDPRFQDIMRSAGL